MAADVGFGSLLRRLRLAADLTLEQLAAASGVSDRAISDMERGVSRGPRVRTVEAIADGLDLPPEGRAELLAAARAGRGGGSSSPAAVGRLPVPRRVADFTGRHTELAQVAEWFAGAAPVVVISGPPGVGKTSLAVQAAQAVDAGERYFLDLRGLDAEPLTPAVALGRLIRAVSPSTGVLPGDVDEAAALWHTLIRGKRIVVVLDNAISESQVRPVLPAEGPAVVVVTSRRVLSGLEGVRRLRLDPLPDEDAVSLLAAILDVPAEAAALRKIAELCVNTPLALRIAGNRLVSRPGWTADHLIARLADQERRLDALSAGDLQVKAAFTLSYQQLSGVARRLFRRLALVPGSSIGVELAAVLVEEPVVATEDALDELVDLSLLQQRGDGRLQFHDLLRLYAGVELDREEGAADRAAAVRRRDTWLLDTVVVAGRCFEPGYGIPPPGATTLVEFATAGDADRWLRDEAENWLPALLRADDRRVIDVAESLHWFSDGWSVWPGWLDVFTLSVAAAGRLADDGLQSVHEGYLAWVYLVCQFEPAKALQHAQRSLAHARRHGDLRQLGWSFYYVAWALRSGGQPVDAVPYTEGAVDSFRRAGDREGLPNALLQRGLLLQSLGRVDEAIPVLSEIIDVVTDPATAPPEHIALFVQTTTYNLLGDAYLRAERWPDALRELDAAVAVVERLNNPARLAQTLARRSLAHARLHDAAAARADLRRIAEIRESLDDKIYAIEVVKSRAAEAEAVLAAGEER